MAWIAFMAPLASCGVGEPADAPQATWVGGSVCGECHQAEAGAWAGSHHDLAMQPATQETVLGDFGNALVTGGDTVLFFRRDGDFMVRTAGPDGEMDDFQVEWTFGAIPLQQYLVTLEGGRLQTLTVAWDSRPPSQGGQRWFHLYEDGRAAWGTPLHWSRPTQSWNPRCASCHSTGLSASSPDDPGPSLSWSDPDVACEACHGPGSLHVTAARIPGAAPQEVRGHLVPLQTTEGEWVRDPLATTAHRTSPLSSRVEVETCAPCHSRRTDLTTRHTPGQAFLDGYEPSLLREGLYHADGQIEDEVYVYGSFVQSRMYASGVTCSDCHEPHGLGLRAEGNALCVRCHDQERFDDPSHHLHPAGSPGGECVACHMPATTYMGVDPRRDHGLRIPRPDLTSELGLPNPCGSCHGDRAPEWAANALARRHGPPDSPHFAQALTAGRQGDPAGFDALSALGEDVSRPPIVRATALSLMGNYRRVTVPAALRRGLLDPRPLVRLGALDALRAWPRADVAPLTLPLLRDETRAVRIRAGRLLVDLLPDRVPSEFSAAAAAVWAELNMAHLANDQRSDGWVAWADLMATRGMPQAADSALRHALALDSLDLSAWLNLADLERATGRDDQAAGTLSTALARFPQSAELHHAWGLHQVRQGNVDDALTSLAAAADRAPENARFGYVHAIALASQGDTVQAVQVLRGVVGRHRWDAETLAALANFSVALGDSAAAAEYAARLASVLPDDPAAVALRRSIPRRGSPPPPE